MPDTLILRTAFLFFFAIMLLWYVSMGLREGGNWRACMPFLAFGVLFCVLSAFVYYRMNYTLQWFMFDVATLVIFVWVLAILIRTIFQKLP